MMSSRDRSRLWGLIAITFVLTFFEAASLLSILPFLRLLAEPDLVHSEPALAWLYTQGGFTDTHQFLIWAGGAVFAVTVIGLAMKTATIWLTTRFALMRSYSFSARLLTNYLHQPYEWFLARHSAELGNAILAEVDKVVSEALLPAMRLIPETFTVVLLVAALCLLEPEIAIGGALVLGGAYGAVFISIRKLVTRLGRRRFEANRQRFHIVQEATGGVKELKLMRLEDGFLTRFRHAAYRMATAQTQTQVIAAIPRQAIEALAFGGMILLILFLLARGGGDVSSLVPTLGLIAAVGLRLIPALQQVYYRSTTLRQSQAVLEKIHGDMTNLAPDPDAMMARKHHTEPLALQNALDLRAVSFSYADTPRAALRHLDLTIPANTSVGIVGGTGAGKTTLVDIILGLLVPTEGQMFVDETEINIQNRHAWQKTLGYVPQTIFLSDGSIAENIAFGVPKDDIDMDAVVAAAQIAELDSFVRSETPNGYDTFVGERGVRLSGGQRQRIGIARALYHNPSTLILDEATSALDTLTESAVMESVRTIAGRKTIIMIAHRLSTVKDCDKIHFLQHGKVVASGTFSELVASNEAFRRMARDVDVVKPVKS